MLVRHIYSATAAVVLAAVVVVDTGSPSDEWMAAAQSVVHMLQVCLAQVLRLFVHPSLTASTAVMPSLLRLTTLLKSQSLKTIKNNIPCFYAKDYLEHLLRAVYQRMQYDEDFQFDADDDDDVEEMEVSL